MLFGVGIVFSQKWYSSTHFLNLGKILIFRRIVFHIFTSISCFFFGRNVLLFFLVFRHYRSNPLVRTPSSADASPIPRHSGAICRAWSRPAARPVYRAWVHSWRCVLRVARPGRWSSRPRTCTTPVRPTSCTSRRESRPGNYKKCYFL